MVARIYLLSLILLFTTSCTLSTQQETQLNKDIKTYILIRNEGDALSYLNYTHPIIVTHYKNQGDSILKNKFQELPKKKNQHLNKKEIIYWNKAYTKGTKSNDSILQAKIELTLLRKDRELDSSVVIFATSTHLSENWLFVSHKDYFNVFPKGLRLFSE